MLKCSGGNEQHKRNFGFNAKKNYGKKAIKEGRSRCCFSCLFEYNTDAALIAWTISAGKDALWHMQLKTNMAMTLHTKTE